jgi:hypothetical protein
MNIGELLIAALAGPLEAVGKEKFKELFKKIEPAETRATILTTLYTITDAELEKLSKASKNKIDDAIVGALKGACEETAAELNIVLPNVDGD